MQTCLQLSGGNENCRPSLFYVGLCCALATPIAANAQDTSAIQLDTISVESSHVPANINNSTLQSRKFTAPLLDTPKSVQVVPKEVLKQQNAQSLQQVLDNVPGVTFTSGEGRGGWGDMFTIRGFSAEQTVTVDGIHQSLLTNRNDLFNLEQAEVYKGSGAIEAGVGAVGGSVNLVSKTPQQDTFYDFDISAGNADYSRITADINQEFGESGAFRLNVMKHKSGVAKRDQVEFDRKGFAPSIAWGLGTPTRLTASYFYQKEENTPDWGIPLTHGGKRMRGMKRDYAAGYKNLDREDSKEQSALFRFEHDFNDDITISNQTGWFQTKQFNSLSSGGRMLNVPAGYSAGDVVYGSVNMNDFYGQNIDNYDFVDESYPSGYLAMARLVGITNRYKGETLANQTDLTWNFQTGFVEHKLSSGLDLYQEKFRRTPYSLPVAAGRMVVDVRHPAKNYVGDLTTAKSTDRSGAKVKNTGVYIYDHISFNDYWSVAAGLRYDRYKVNWYDSDGRKENYQQRKGVWGGSVGLTYKPIEDLSIYASYEQTKEPAAAAVAGRSGGGGSANASHMSNGKSKTWEVGTKWNILGEDLGITAAIFEVEKSNPTDTDPDDPTKFIQQSRKERVRGIELGVTGYITPLWNVYAGATYLDAKIIKDDALTGAGHSQKGGKMKNVPKTTFNLWSGYQVTPEWDVGGGVQYVGKRYFYAGNYITNNSDQSVDYRNNSKMPDHWVFNATTGYQVNENVALRLNIENLFNKFYLTRGSASRLGTQNYGIPGAGRTFIVSGDIRF